MKTNRELLGALATSLVLLGCQGGTTDPAVTLPEMNPLLVKIISVRPEMDGNTLVLHDENGAEYQAVISIPNLGPESDFDFGHLRPGNQMIVSGEHFEIRGRKHLTIFEAKAI